MFANAIEKMNGFTRPMHTITRTYGGLVTPGTSTLFFVNENGFAITCRHVLDLIIGAEQVNAKFEMFKKERNALSQGGKYRRQLKDLETRYGYKNETTVQIKNMFRGCVDSWKQLRWHVHPELDLAVLIFDGFKEKFYSSHAVFVKDPKKIRQGRYLCRYGFPFPEFNNFHFNTEKEDLEWLNTGVVESPSFPIDGIITRFVGSQQQINSIEMSTPGLKGQSGGPLFDADGLVYGMQHLTGHLYLGFDVKDQEVIKEGKRTKISDSAFLHVGHCIHADRIRQFLSGHGIKYYEE